MPYTNYINTTPLQMAATRWTAKLFVNSDVGEIDAEVYASTYPGAKQQIQAKYGDVQQIYNLRQASGSASSSSGGAGCLPLLGLGLLVIIGGVFGGGSDDKTPTETYQNAPVERVQAAPAPVAPAAEPQFRDYASPPPSYCITENFEPC